MIAGAVNASADPHSPLDSHSSLAQLVAQPTVAQPPVADEPRGSAIDAWWARRLRSPLRQKLWYWGGPLLVLAVAAIARLWNLGYPHALVFDETYYVKDAYSLGQLGYEGSWPNNANPQFEQGDTSGLSPIAEFVVHPPLGKWMIWLGIHVFGVDNAFGWRITTALAGIVAVWVVMMVARRLTDSTLLAVIAGSLMAVDGTAIVMSRVAILDNWVMLFSLLGVAAVLADRNWHERRLRARLTKARSGNERVMWGPAFWWRPWLLTAGALFGATAAVKWSGVWFLAAFGAYLVAVDALARKRAGLPLWFSAAVLKQGPIAALQLVLPAIAVYLASWSGWLLTSGGWDRNWATEQGYSGPWPNWLVSLLHYHQQAYNYHVTLTTPHPYQANPLTWLFMIRPTSMYYVGSSAGENGCTADQCSSAITDLGNPLIWWAAAAAAFFLVWRLIRRREWQIGLILLGLAAGYLPWFMYLNRTVFQFYSIAFFPYLVLGLTWCLGLILGSRDDPRDRRERGIVLVGGFLALVVAVSVFFYPLWTGMQVPFVFWQSHIWFPSWR